MLSSRRKVKKSQNNIYADLIRIKDSMKDTAGEVKGRASDLLNDLIEEVQDRTSSVQSEIKDYAKDKPLQSLGIAVLLGVIIGKIVL